MLFAYKRFLELVNDTQNVKKLLYGYNNDKTIKSVDIY